MFDALASLGLMAVTAFVAATIFPAQSELVFVGAATHQPDRWTVMAPGL
jgi:membrane protein YqaA with SNARE-associated domain